MSRRLVVRSLAVVAAALLAALVYGAANDEAVSSTNAGLTATQMTPTSSFSAAKTLSGRMARTDRSLLRLRSAAPVNVLIKYDVEPVASYQGGIPGLAATSPSVTHHQIRANPTAVVAYTRHLAGVMAGISRAALRAVPGLRIRESFAMVYGGVVARVPGDLVGRLLQVPGVAAVQRDGTSNPVDDTAFIGATAVWPSLGGQATAGQGEIIGLLDTGVWPEHPALKDNGLPAPPGAYGCQFGNGSDPLLGAAFTCNHKLIGAYAFTDSWMANNTTDGHLFCNDATGKCSARDPRGHGTHTATTAAGDRVASAPLLGVNRGPFSGVAPGAQVIEYRVCVTNCFTSDIVAGIQQGVLDGVSVLSMSLGSTAQVDPYADPTMLAFLDAYNAGIPAAVAAGNQGPSAGTATNLAPWVTTVGAATANRNLVTSTLHLTASNSDVFTMPGQTITAGASGPVVLAQNLPGEDALCQAALAPGTATGDIVMCQRGTNARVLKGYNVLQGGAAGMILYNPVAQDLDMDTHWLPTIHVDGPSTNLLNFVNSHTGIVASWPAGTPATTRGDVMASFSSRGPGGDFIKPDLVAPGVNVFAGWTPMPDGSSPSTGPSGNLYSYLSGTSMATPHVAGSMLLLKALHPSWTPDEIKSALMTSTMQDSLKEDGITPATPFDAGAGALRVNRAATPTVVFDETYADYAASSSDRQHRINLNMPSIDAPNMPGSITTSRTALNVSGQAIDLVPSATAPAGAKITVGTHNELIHIEPGASATFTVTINAPTLPDGQYFGRITLKPQQTGLLSVTIPVAFFHRQPVSLTQSCSPTSIGNAGLSHCVATATNLSQTDQPVTLTVSGKGLAYRNIAAPATAGTGGVTWSGTLAAPHPGSVASIVPGGAGYGYVPLSSYGVTPISNPGDETITTFTINPILYGGETYTQVGMVTDGYLVIGGGSGSDIVSHPQTFPDANRPNNVVAPFWTDLNPQTGGGMYAGYLHDNVHSWAVYDWENVPNFTNGTTHSFEVWLQLGTTPGSEGVFLEYGTSGAGDPVSGTNWGAENSDGTSGQNLASQPPDGSQWTVDLTTPTPSGSQSLLYDISGKTPGTYTSTAKLTSSAFLGFATALQAITITPPGPLDHFKVTVSPLTLTAGASLTVKVTAQDAAGNTVTSYAGPATLSDLSGHLSVISPLSWVGGVGTATVTSLSRTRATA